MLLGLLSSGSRDFEDEVLDFVGETVLTSREARGWFMELVDIFLLGMCGMWDAVGWA